MNQYLIVIIPSIISVISIFISNYLGQKTVLRVKEYERKTEIYETHYLPIITFLYQFGDPSRIVYKAVATIPSEENKHHFVHNLYKNFKYLSPDVAMKLNSFMSNSALYLEFIDENYQPFGREFTQSEINQISNDCEQQFKEIIVLSLKEAEELSKELKFPNLAGPILKPFLSS